LTSEPAILRRALGQAREVELDHRQRLGLAVAEHRDVHLAAFDVLLDQDRRVELLLQLVDALHEVLDRLAQRVERDADRAVLARGLDDHRELQVVRPVEAPAMHGGEIRRPDPVEGEDLLGERLVLREVEAARPGAVYFLCSRVEVGGEVDVLGVVAGPRLGEVEDQVALEIGQGLERLGVPSISK
jgi:hypothetical protein